MEKAEIGRSVSPVDQLKDRLIVHIKELGKKSANIGRNSELFAVITDLKSSCVTEDVFYEHFGAVLLSFVGIDHLLSDETTKIVSALLEAGGSCREVVWLNCDRIYEKLLTGIDLQSFHTNDDRLQLTVRVVLKLEQHLFDRWKTRRRSGSNSFCCRIRTTLLRVMNNSEFPLESVFLAGTAFAFYLHSLNVQLSSLLSVEQQLENCFSEMCLQEPEIKNCFINPVASGRSVQLPLVHGLLVCGKTDILLSRSNGIGGKGLFVLDILPLICGFCDGGDCRVYHSFQTLLSWLSWMRSNLERVTAAATKEADIFALDGTVVTSVCRIFDLGFSSFVTGVPDLSWDAYDILLEIHKMEGGNGFLDLLNATMKLPWTVKGKYPRLAMLVRHIGTTTLLLHLPGFLDGLRECLASNPLASLGSVVYRNLLIFFRFECENVAEEEVALRWETTFLPALLATLRMSNSISLQNAIRHWLPATIEMFPKAYSQLCCGLMSFRTSPNTFFVLTSVHRLARSLGIVTFEDVDDFVLNEALLHSDEIVRAEAYAVVCLSHKKSELVSVEEMESLRSFLPMNLNIVNPSFRGKIFCHSKVLLVRLRDSCLNLFTKKKKTESISHTLRLDDVEKDLIRSTDFLDWFLCLLLDNLRLGGCYQRRHTCLNLYRILMEVFVSAPSGNSRKGIVPVKCRELLSFFLSLGKFQLFSDRATRLLLFCILDYMEEIQSLAVGILKSYFSCELKDRMGYTDWALRLCSSPKSMHAESGSRLFVFVFSGLDREQRIETIQLVLRKLKEQLAVAEADMLAASTDAPMHGLVLALKHVVCFDPNLWSNDGHRSKFLSEDCLFIAERIVQHVLGILASKSDTDEVAPSFEEMGLAIEDIVGSSNGNDPAVSIEHQLVSSCCWLSLKDCALLLGSMVDHLPLEGIAENYSFSLHQVNRVCTVMYSILTKCRHRGAIEACSLGLEVFCRKLLGSGCPSLTDVLVTMLSSALSELLNTASQTSVTRRSAGLPLLVVTVVKNDRRPSRPLLSAAVKRLLDVAESSPVDDDTVGGVVDDPRAHSFHVLRALVHESVLSLDILVHMNAIVPACLEGFFSPSWAVRNASLQLFGAIVPRLIGQKKVADDESDLNGMTFSDFCARWPALFILLKSHMRGDIGGHNRWDTWDITDLTQTVVPVLSLFCRLSGDVSSASEGTEMVSLVSPLLGCPVWHVRRQAALFVAKMCPKHHLHRLFLDLSRTLCEDRVSSNHAHGLLLAMLDVVRNFGSSAPSSDLVVKLKRTFSKVLCFVMGTFSCPVLSNAILNVGFASPHWLQSQLEWKQLTNLKTSYSDWEPGFGSWMKSVTIVHSRELQTVDLISRFETKMASSSSEVVEAFLSVVKQKTMDSVIGVSFEDYSRIQQLLLSFCETFAFSSMLHTCLQLMLDIYFRTGVGFSFVDAERVLKVATFLLSTNRGFFSATAIILWSLVIIKDQSLVATDPEKWVEQVNDFCRPRLSEDVRLGASKGLTIAGPFLLEAILSLRGPDSFGDLVTSDCVIGIFDSGLTLLQDEDTDVRNQAAKFVASLRTDRSCGYNEIHPNVAIRLLGDYFLCRFGWNEKLWTYLWKKITSDLSIPFTMKNSHSLFDQDDVNVYAEKCFMSTFYSRLLRHLLLDGDFRLWFAERTSEVLPCTRDAVRDLFNRKEADNMSMYCMPRVALYLTNLHSCLEVLLDYAPSSAESKEAIGELQSLIGFT